MDDGRWMTAGGTGTCFSSFCGFDHRGRYLRGRLGHQGADSGFCADFWTWASTPFPSIIAQKFAEVAWCAGILMLERSGTDDFDWLGWYISGFLGE